MRIIAGNFRSKAIIAPPTIATRPTSDRVREMIFNVLEHNPLLGRSKIEGKRVLDVFAGSGALGLEAYSRGASYVGFIENNPLALKAIEKNLINFKINDYEIIKKKVEYLPFCNQVFDLVFLDPPYQSTMIESILNMLKEKKWVSPQSVIVVEVAKNSSFTVPAIFETLLHKNCGPAQIFFLKT